MGRRHIRGLRALQDVGMLDFDLVAVCDLEPDAARRASDDAEALLGTRPRIVADLDTLVRDDSVVALDIVTEPASHHRLAVPALTAGRHVLCEKPLSVTLRGCRSILDAHAAEVFLVSTTWAGGDDRILLTAWRHLREKGAIALDVAVHLTDIQQYLLGGPFVDVWGRGFIAEPIRRRGDVHVMQDLYGEALARGPAEVRATGEDSVVALYRMTGGASAFLAWIPSGPGHRYHEHTLHGRAGSMVLPSERSGQDLEVRLAAERLGAEALLRELPEPVLDEVTRRLFPDVVYPDRPFAEVDAAHIGLTVHDFGRAILDGRRPEVDGQGATDAVAAILGAIESEALGRAVGRAELLAGSIAGAQADIDRAIGLA
jgi:predicted dehydrogenase